MGDKKKRTLCEYKKEEIKDNLDEVKKIVLPATYICRKCARVAADKDNLCKPEKI